MCVLYIYKINFYEINRVAKPLNILNFTLNHANIHFLFHNGNKCSRNMILFFSKKSISKTEGGWAARRETFIDFKQFTPFNKLNVSWSRMIRNREIVAQTKHETLLFFCAKFNVFQSFWWKWHTTGKPASN